MTLEVAVGIVGVVVFSLVFIAGMLAVIRADRDIEAQARARDAKESEATSRSA